MNKAKILKALAVLALGSVAATVTSSVFVYQENALSKEIKVLKNKRKALESLKDKYPKYGKEIDQILTNNPVAKRLADENFSSVRTKTKNIQIKIDQINKNLNSENHDNDSVNNIDKTKYNSVAQQAKEFLDQISKSEKYAGIYKYLHSVKDSTDEAVSKDKITQNKVDFETNKLQDALNEANKNKEAIDKNVDSKTNQQLQDQGDEILDAMKAERLRADKKYDEILQLANDFLGDLNTDETSKTKYADIISNLNEDIKNQNAIRNDSSKSARDVLDAKDKLLEALNKAAVDKKILDGKDVNPKLEELKNLKSVIDSLFASKTVPYEATKDAIYNDYEKALVEAKTKDTKDEIQKIIDDLKQNIKVAKVAKEAIDSFVQLRIHEAEEFLKTMTHKEDGHDAQNPHQPLDKSAKKALKDKIDEIQKTVNGLTDPSAINSQTLELAKAVNIAQIAVIESLVKRSEAYAEYQTVADELKEFLKTLPITNDKYTEIKDKFTKPLTDEHPGILITAEDIVSKRDSLTTSTEIEEQTKLLKAALEEAKTQKAQIDKDVAFENYKKQRAKLEEYKSSSLQGDPYSEIRDAVDQKIAEQNAITTETKDAETVKEDATEQQIKDATEVLKQAIVDAIKQKAKKDDDMLKAKFAEYVSKRQELETYRDDNLSTAEFSYILSLLNNKISEQNNEVADAADLNNPKTGVTIENIESAITALDDFLQKAKDLKDKLQSYNLKVEEVSQQLADMKVDNTLITEDQPVYDKLNQVLETQTTFFETDNNKTSENYASKQEALDQTLQEAKSAYQTNKDAREEQRTKFNNETKPWAEDFISTLDEYPEVKNSLQTKLANAQNIIDNPKSDLEQLKQANNDLDTHLNKAKAYKSFSDQEKIVQDYIDAHTSDPESQEIADLKKQLEIQKGIASNPNSTEEEIAKATEYIKQFKKVTEAKTTYNEVISKVKDKLSDDKYAPLLEAFNKANKDNQTTKDTPQDDLEAWTEAINQATVEAQKIADKVDEVLPKFDELDKKHKKAETEKGTDNWPMIAGKDDNGHPVDDIYKGARLALDDAQVDSLFMDFDLLDPSEYDEAITRFDQHYKEAYLQKHIADLKKAIWEAFNWGKNNVKGGIDEYEEFKDEFRDIYTPALHSGSIEKIIQATKDVKAKLEAKKAEKKDAAKQAFNDKVQDITQELKKSQDSDSLNGQNELTLIEATEELVNSDIENMSAEEIDNLNKQIDAKIAEFNKKSTQESEYWDSDYAVNEDKASAQNIDVTLKNTTDNNDDNNIIGNMNNNVLHPSSEETGKNPYSTDPDSNDAIISGPITEKFGYKKLVDKTTEYGNRIQAKINKANIGNSTNLDKFMRKSINKSIEEFNVLASMIIPAPMLEFDQNTALLKYLRRYYGSDLTNKQYGLWSELASQKLIPAFAPRKLPEPVIGPRFNMWSVINKESLDYKVPVYEKDGVTKAGWDWKWRNTNIEGKDEEYIWKYSLVAEYRFDVKLQTYILAVILLQDGAYPIFEKSLDYALQTYEYLKPENLKPLREKLMNVAHSPAEKIAITKALATAKAKFTSALKNMQLDDSQSLEPIKSYEDEISEILNSSKGTYSETSKLYLKQATDYIVNQHDSAATDFDKAYTLKHALDNFKVIVDPAKPGLIENENEAITDPSNINKVIEAYAILVDLTHKYLSQSDQINWLEPTNTDFSDPKKMTQGVGTYNLDGTHQWTDEEAEKFKDYAPFESSKYTFKKNVDQKLDFVNRKLLTTYSSDDQSETRKKLQAKYSAWKTKYTEISNSGDDESAYGALLDTILSEYKEILNKDLGISEK